MGDPRFHQILKEMGELHDKKQRDYGSQTDPFANVRGSQNWGVPPWVGAMIRANDKVKRLQAFADKGELANESAEDSLIDLANYAVIALVLMREEKATAESKRRHDEQAAIDQENRLNFEKKLKEAIKEPVPVQLYPVRFA